MIDGLKSGSLRSSDDTLAIGIPGNFLISVLEMDSS